MLIKSLKKSLLAVLVVSSVSNADQGGIGWAPGYDGGDQHHLCDNPYDPNCGSNSPDYPGQPDYPDYNDGQSEVKSIYVGRSVRNETLDLRRLSGIGTQYRGYEIVSVRGRTRPNSPYQTTVQLVADNRIVDTQINPGQRINLVPNRRLVIGSTVRELGLYVNGSTFIDELVIELRRSHGVPNHPQPPQYPDHPGYEDRLDLYIGETVQGNDRIDVTRHIDMYQHRGRRIQKIIVEADAQYNVALAEVIINGWSAGTLQFDNYTRSQALRLPGQPDIGGAASSIVLYTRGNMRVNRVTLVLR